jgi:methionyl aminopeptidase
MRLNKNNFTENSLIVLKDELWLKRQKRAGRCVANILKECGNLIKATTPNLSLKDLEQLTYLYTRSMDCTPTFLNYKGFPGAACISVNKQLVHGIPTDYILQDGDIVSVDLGATFEGAIADAARTWIYGNPKSPEHVRLLKVGREALDNGVKAVKVGARLGEIGYAIHNTVKNSGFNSIVQYGGHHLSYNQPHADCFISNKSDKNSGNRIQNGEAMAIEPMVVMGEPLTSVLNDGWTVVTPGLGCHFENSVTVFDNKVYIITEIPNEN